MRFGPFNHISPADHTTHPPNPKGLQSIAGGKARPAPRDGRRRRLAIHPERSALKGRKNRAMAFHSTRVICELRLCDAFSLAWFMGAVDRLRRARKARPLPPAMLCKAFGFYAAL